MEMYGYEIIRESDLTHHGIKGQKWGVRRFQNEDGSWTAAGKERYGDGTESARSSRGSASGFSGVPRKLSTSVKQNDLDRQKRVETLKKVAKVGAAVAGTALVAYGAYKLNNLATESLKAGDRYMAKQKDAMGDFAMKNYFEQMEIADNYRGNKPITNSTPKEVAEKYMRMVDTAHEAGSRGQRFYNEARQLQKRADAGKYTLGEKVGALKNIQNNKKLVRAENRRSNQHKRHERMDDLKYYAGRALPLSVLRRTLI